MSPAPAAGRCTAYSRTFCHCRPGPALSSTSTVSRVKLFPAGLGRVEPGQHDLQRRGWHPGDLELGFDARVPSSVPMPWALPSWVPGRPQAKLFPCSSTAAFVPAL